MEKYSKLPLWELDKYPAADTEAVHRKFLEEYEHFSTKIAVLDDDPTGVQTVHGVHVYTDWSEESLKAGLEEENRMFFILTNSRSFTAERTEREHKTLARRMVRMAAEAGKEFLLVSRGDSTLRGHYPLELEALREVLEQETGQKIHGQILCPFFREGGRYTMEGVHYVKEGEYLVPAGQTEFAGDKTFGYSCSHLAAYAEEKSGGRYRKEDAVMISLSLLRAGRYEEITELLMGADDFRPVVVDALAESDVEVFATCLLRAMKAGKRFLIRCAAAVPKVLGNVSTIPLLTREELLGDAESAVCGGGQGVESAVCGEERRDDSRYGGIVLVGSHVKKTTLQLEALRKAGEDGRIRSGLEFLEFEVGACFAERGLEGETKRVIAEAEKVMSQGKTAVVYTSRKLLAPEGMAKEELLRLSVDISDAVTAVIAGLHRKPRFLIAKGGITSSDVGTKALRVRKALVLGQAQPGIPVWRTGLESRFPGLSYIIFPGNVGDTDTLEKIVEMLA